MSLIYQAPAPAAGQQQQRRPGLYLGGKADAKDCDQLHQWNVTHILNMTPPKQAGIQAGVPNYFESAGTFTYKRIPILDASTSVSELLDQSDAICNFIATGLCHGSVLVHCQRGASRSTTAVLLYLMKCVHMTLHQAVVTVKRRRLKADPIPAFMRMLQEYEATCIENGVIALTRVPMSSSAETAATAAAKKKGPALGPTLPPPSEQAKRKRPMIGPSIGRAKSSELAATDAKRKRSIGPVIGPSIGPSIGPTVGPSIGPSTGPAATKKDDQSESAGPRLKDATDASASKSTSHQSN